VNGGGNSKKNQRTQDLVTPRVKKDQREEKSWLLAQCGGDAGAHECSGKAAASIKALGVGLLKTRGGGQGSIKNALGDAGSWGTNSINRGGIGGDEGILLKPGGHAQKKATLRKS